MTPRTIPPALASTLEDLELNQPRLITFEDVELLRSRLGVPSSARYLVEQLIKAGWLLPLKTRGVWEFAPGSRAGAFGAGDRFIELRAALRKRPQLSVTIAAESAAWLHGLSSRPPSRDVIASTTTAELPPALSEFRVVHHLTKLPPVTIDDLPVWSVASLLAAMAQRPSSYKDWPNVLEWLPEATQRIAFGDFLMELDSSPRATWARLAYLLAIGGHEREANELIAHGPPGNGPYYLGRRDRAGHHDRRFDVVDSALVASTK